MISVRGVTKRYGSRTALHPLDLDVPRGVACGLLGHNGAGKSTLIGMLLGQVFADAGEIRIDGHDILSNRMPALRNVGAIFETPAFCDYLSGARNLRLLAAYSGAVDPARFDEVVRLVGLERRIDDRVATYSHGMRRRLALAQALLPHPELLILDEPSDGLDPEGIQEMRQLIQRLQREHGLTILFSSHGLADAQEVCSQFAVLREGRLMFAGDWRTAGLLQPRLRIQVDRQAAAEQALVAANLMFDFRPDGSGTPADGVAGEDVARWLFERGFVVRAFVPLEPSLEDFYFATQRRGRDA